LCPTATARFPGAAKDFRLQEVRTGTAADPTLLQRLWYDYDSKGSVTEIRDYKAKDAGHSYQRLTFGYDDLDRLSWAKAEWGSAGNYDYSGSNGYTYDPIGNLTKKEGVVQTYTGPHKHAVTTAGGNVYQYDANGNMTSGAGRTINWDAENRAASVIYGGQTTTFAYGPAGERVKVVVGSVTTVYVGDYYEKNLSTGVVTTYYVFGGRRVALKQGASTYWLHPDHLGSTALVTDGSGGQAGERRYYPWGPCAARRAGTRARSGCTPGSCLTRARDCITMEPATTMSPSADSSRRTRSCREQGIPRT